MKNVWIIQAETNIHVGNENTTGAGLIDKAVQRNVLTRIPCINASSLKGAMNEYATSEAKLTPTERVAIFGVDKEQASKEVDTQKGSCLFFDAHLLLLPIQDDKHLYKLVTCKETLEEYISLLKLMGINYSYADLIKELKSLDPHFDGEEGDGKGIIRDFDKFKQLCSDDELPIIARNCLMGKGNLWYEQVLPQKSVFGTMLIAPAEAEVAVKVVNPTDKKKAYKYEPVKGIDQKIINTFDRKVVQIGANATIGYGYCTFTKIKEG